MERAHVESLSIQSYGCIKNIRLNLTPLHALIGPNDSGKSTVLMALRTLSTIADGPLLRADDGGKLRQAIQDNPNLAIAADARGDSWRLAWQAGELRGEGADAAAHPINYTKGTPTIPPQVRRALAGSILLRLEPDALRAPTPLIQEGQPLRFQNALGLGLPAVYDAIVTRDLPAYMKLNEQLKSLYPTVKSLSLKNPSTSTKAIGVQLTDGTFVGADFMSEGMLYYLAFAALSYLEPAALILVEEPENGLHPARIREVMQVLREVSKTTQIVLATHSPLVINELKPDEVTVLTRTAAEGTRACLIKDTPNFVERSQVYALGELWVSYADGNLEAPLFTEPEVAPPKGESVEWHDTDEH